MPGCAEADRRRARAPGRFRCAEILEGLGDQQARSLKHHILCGLHSPRSAGTGTATRSAGNCRGNSAEHGPGRHFVTRLYPSKPAPKKGRKETPASSYRASAPEPGPRPLLRGRWASHCAVAQLLGNRRREERPSLTHARSCLSRGAGACGWGLRTLVTCRPPYTLRH